MKALLYTVAKDANDNVVDARNAEKGSDFFCPLCSTALTLRKSGRMGKGTKRPHFAHRTLTPNCTPETALHHLFKQRLAAKLERHIENRTPLAFAWKCTYCSQRHYGNLMKNTHSVKVEYDLNVCRPDIALLDSESQVFAVVEVVVTHKPEKGVVKFYEENKIVLIQIELTSDEDIDKLDNKISNPDGVGICYNPRCRKCGQYQQRTKMTIVDSPCWSCGMPMKVAIVHGNKLNAGSHLGPDRFTKKEIEFAKSRGVNLNSKYSGTLKQRYLANSCPKCPSFVGNHCLFTSYFAPATNGELPSTEFEIGYHCDHSKP